MDPVNLMEDEPRDGKSPQCTAKSKRSGQRCRRPVPGGGVCATHGGKARQVQRRREARIALAQAQAMYGDEYLVRDPGDVLLAAVADGDAIVQKLKAQIQASESVTGADLLALGEWLDRAARMSKAVLDLKLAERQVRLAEGQGLLVADVLRGAIADLGHDPRDPVVVHVLSTRLRELQAGRP